MLVKITSTNSDAEFAECLKDIRRAYWPDREISRKVREIRNKPGFLPKNADDELCHERIAKLREDVSREVSANSLYKVHEGKEKGKGKTLPFMARFYKFFLLRKWPEAPKDVRRKSQDLWRFAPRPGKNCSKNYGNYCHFVNVVAAMARLIYYFSDVENVKTCLLKHETEERKGTGNIDWVGLCGELVFEREDRLRIFNLMLAAFYHDLGKTVVDVRHGMEGAILLLDHTSLSWYQLKCIAEAYGQQGLSFDYESLIFLADMLMYHDLFGTLSTGESTYPKMTYLLNGIQRQSLRYVTTDKDLVTSERIKWGRRLLFDLWLLNLADVMVSMRDKWSMQPVWLNLEESKVAIRSFFAEEERKKASVLVHDLRIAFALLDYHSTDAHTDDLSGLEAKALEYARRHAVERLRRLIYESVFLALEEAKKDDNDQVELFGEHFAQYCKREDKLNIDIMRAVQCIVDYQEFCGRIASIGHMDYALGFFKKIASRALGKVLEELRQIPGIRTGWIRVGDPNELGGSNYEVQVKFFMQNYTAIVVDIIGHLLFREKQFDGLRNLEFSDASERLTGEKMDSICALKGPHHSRRSTQLILQSIFYW